MIDDVTRPGERRKPKIILPIEKPTMTPLAELVADEPSELAPLGEPLAPATAIVPVSEAPHTDDASQTVSDKVASETQADDDTAAKKGWREKLKIQWPLTKRQKIIGSVSAVLAMFLIGFGWAHFAHTTKPVLADTKPKTAVKVAPKPTTVASTLTGLQVDPAVNQRPVTAVMIENSPDARPQSGLDQAGVVFEALAEGGVTRFMALFQDTQPDYIGPVRSARPYYVQWALGFNAGYAHVGGSPDALADIKSWGVRDLDQFYNSGAYQRISSRDAPHNVYTSTAALNQLETSKGYTSSTYTGFSRKADTPTKTTPTASSIDMTFSGAYYNTHYDYDAASNSYKRSEAGAPHMEVNGAGAQTQITPKVVIAMVVPMVRGALDASGAYYSDYNPLGTGQAYIFQDGTVTIGSCSKSTNAGALTFNDANNQPMQLNAGQTWISALPGPNVTYK